MAECDKILAGKSRGKKASGGTMNDAVSGTEAIRTWNDHRIGLEKLCEKFNTVSARGLTDNQAK